MKTLDKNVMSRISSDGAESEEGTGTDIALK